MVKSNKSIRFYYKYYRLIAIAVIVMMAVLSGSLLLGDSVRGTLVDRVQERLGSTETIISSGTGFINEEIMSAPLFDDSRGYLVCEGFVSSDEKLIPVMVWSCDKDTIKAGNAIVNEPLQRQLTSDDFVLHLPSHSLVPSGSLFVTQQYSTQLRLHTQGTRNVKDGGNLLLRNEQALPLNVFMNRQELAEVMELQGKLNLIMSPRIITDDDLKKVWTPSMSGMNFNGLRVTSDRIFIPEPVVNALKPSTTCFAYLVNDIYTESDSVPYSFVTATDNWQGETLDSNDMILSDYAASRLHVTTGDTIRMDYYITNGTKSLATRTQAFRIKEVCPLSSFQQDTLLMTEYPGLSNVEHCNDWDSDLPINMSHIKKEDEDFWYTYRQTPKALVSFDAVKADWSTPFGSATALSLTRIIEASDSSSSSITSKASLLDTLTPSLFNIIVTHPRSQALYAANNGTDFSSLFLALGFFIILSGILLMQNPLVEMLSQRRQEIELYSTLGYTNTRIYTILYKEIARITLVASPIGILSGLLYSSLTLFLLGNVWSGATHTEGFTIHINITTLIVAWFSGIIITVLTVWITIRSYLKTLTTKNTSSKKKSKIYTITNSYILIALTAILFIYNLISANSIILFVICGLLWLIATGCYLIARIQRNAESLASFSLTAMKWKTLASQRSQSLLAFWSLAVGVFTVFSVGLNRPDFSHSTEDATITGHFNLWCDCRVPIEYDLNNPQVRDKLSLADLDTATHFMQFLCHTQDEASCLNLNKVSTPTVLATDITTLHENFQIDTAPLSQEISSQTSTFPTYPILIDSESLTWSLMRSVGDTLQYKNSEGEPINIIIAGTYPTGIFHGNAIMNQDHFRQIWPEETGTSLLLVKTPKDKIDDMREYLATALSEYGLSISTTTERIELFFTVTDTYLAIFLTLGGLGMLLGVFCLIIVIRKNLDSRQNELTTLVSLGYKTDTIRQQLFYENLIVPISAILSGAIGSIISISANATGAGLATILTAIIFLLALLILVYRGIKQMINNYTI